jgi:hypothetical protein
MKTITNKTAKKTILNFTGFSKLNINEMLKIRGGDTTPGDPPAKLPD